MRKLLLTAMVFFVAATASAKTLKETIDKTFDVKAGADFVLTNVNGRITVASWDQPRVRVVAYKEVDGDRNDVQQAMRELRVEMQPRDGGLVVTTHFPKHDRDLGSIFDWILGDHIEANVLYDVTVPRNMNVDVTNTNGAIIVTGVSGNHELDTTNGKIEVKNCAGSLDAATTNGSIDAELMQVAKGQPLRFETTNGRIQVAVPANLAMDVDAGTTNGSISTDLPINTTRLSPNSLRGTINGGGTSLRMRTTNGRIAIKTIGKS